MQKVEHPTRSTKGGKGSKDVSDSVAGVVFACVNDGRAIAGATLIEDVEDLENRIVRQIVDPKQDVAVRQQSQRAKKRVGGKTIDMSKLSME